MTADALHRPAVLASRCYETDYYGWLEDQVALLKSGRLSEIDTQNIAEEIKDIGTREYRKLQDAAQALIYNLLKWDLLPDRRSPSMVLSIDAHRDQVTAVLARNPSLQGQMPKAMQRAYPSATYDIMRDSDLPERIFASECPYDWDTLRTRLVEFDAVESPSASEFS